MRSFACANALLLLSAQLGFPAAAARDTQVILGTGGSTPPSHGEHAVHPAVVAALEAHSDPVDAMLAIHPELVASLAERRLLHVRGNKEPEWMTEGDKMRLRRQGKKFVDITEHEEFYKQQVNAAAGKASELRPPNCNRCHE